MSQILHDEIDRLYKVISVHERGNRMLLDQIDRMSEYESGLEDRFAAFKKRFDPHGTFDHVGKTVKANHPITCLNPDEWFEVIDARYDHGVIYVIGAKTCWFRLDQCEISEVKT